jgi:hypothetical protein
MYVFIMARQRVRGSARGQEVFEPLRELITPSVDFIRETPTFGLHGIPEGDVAGFFKDFNVPKLGIGRGHFFYMTEDHRSLSPDEFGIRLRASIGVNTDYSTRGLISFEDGGNRISFKGHPSLILAVTKPGFKTDGDNFDMFSPVLWSPNERVGFHWEQVKTFSKEHDILNVKSTAKPVSFDDDDVRQLNLAWKDYARGRMSYGRASNAQAFAQYYVYQKIAGKIIGELEAEMRRRRERPDLPGLQPSGGR